MTDVQQSSQPLKRASPVFFQFRAGLILVVFCIVSVPLILLLLPVLLFRVLVSKVFAKFKPELGKVLSAQSAFMAADNVYSNTRNSIVTWGEFKGSVNIEKIREAVRTHWIEAVDPEGHAKFPELQQYIRTWFGYSFWCREKYFRVEDHVHHVHLGPEDQGPGGAQGIADMLGGVSNKAYPMGQSPWELMIYTWGDGSQGLQVCRFHHALCDGFAVLKLFSCTMTIDPAAIIETRTGQIKMEEERKSRREPMVMKVLKQMLFSIRAPYSFAKDMVGGAETFADLKARGGHGRLEGDWWCARARKTVPIGLVKELKDRYGVSFQAVLLEAVGTVWRDLLVGEVGVAKLPPFLHIGVPFPSKHPEKLRNAWTMSALQLPIATSDRLSRVKYIEEQIKSLKRGGALMLGDFAPKFIGCLPDALIRLAGRNRTIPAFASIMPGPPSTVVSYGTLVNTKIGFFSPLLCGEAGEAGLGFSAFSYLDDVVISLVADKGIVGELDQVQACADAVVDYVDDLKELLVDIQV